MSVPTYYTPQDALKPLYPARTSAFITDGFGKNIKPAARDQVKTALLLVDYQVDFCHPDGTLYVKGAQEDLARLLNNFFYPNIEQITTVVASLDTHYPFQIFYPTWWRYEDDNSRPAPYTLITLDARKQSVDAATGRVLLPLNPQWTLGHYLPKLKTDASLDLMIWPFHTMDGTAGHDLMPALSEALAFYAGARMAQPIYLRKGVVSEVEHYGIFAPEVIFPGNPSAGLNTAMLSLIANNDLIYVAGEAKSHCVLATMKQLVAYLGNDPQALKKVRFLMDSTSSVAHPAIDFDEIANIELAKMATRGVQLVKTTDSIR